MKASLRKGTRRHVRCSLALALWPILGCAPPPPPTDYCTTLSPSDRAQAATSFYGETLIADDVRPAVPAGDYLAITNIDRANCKLQNGVTVCEWAPVTWLMEEYTGTDSLGVPVIRLTLDDPGGPPQPQTPFPIAGVSVTVQAGEGEVQWPAAIHVFTSDQQFPNAATVPVYYAGELMFLHGLHETATTDYPEPAPGAFEDREVWTYQLETAGRFLYLVPRNDNRIRIKDVKVFKGTSFPPRREYTPTVDTKPALYRILSKLLDQEHLGPIATRGSIAQQVARDLVSVAALAQEFYGNGDIPLSAWTRSGCVLAEVKSRLLEEHEDGSLRISPDEARAVVPLNGLHAETFRQRAELWSQHAAYSGPSFRLWRLIEFLPPVYLEQWAVQVSLPTQSSAPWQPLELNDPRQTDAVLDATYDPAAILPLKVALMRGETRSTAFFLTNASTTGQSLRIQATLGEMENPWFVEVLGVPWTSVSRGKAVALALETLPLIDGHYRIDVPPGMTMQVWLRIFLPVDSPAEGYEGWLKIRDGAGFTQRMDLSVSALEGVLPERLRLAFGGFDYAGATLFWKDSQGLSPVNSVQLVNYLKANRVNAPWADQHTLRVGQFVKGPDPTTDVMVAPDGFLTDSNFTDAFDLFTDAFDLWIARWKGILKPYPVRAYSVLLHDNNPPKQGAFGDYVSQPCHLFYQSLTVSPCNAAKDGSKVVSRRLKSDNSINPDFVRAVGAWARFWADQAQKRGVDPALIHVYVTNEPHDPLWWEIAADWATAIEGSGAGIRVITDAETSQGNISMEVESGKNQTLADLINTADVVIVKRKVLDRDAEFLESLGADGNDKEVWVTAGRTPMYDIDPYRFARLQAWLAWRHKLKGMLFWRFVENGWRCGEAASQPPGSSWNQFANLNRSRGYTPRSYDLLFVDCSSVAGGKHFEAAREGVQDFEYLAMHATAASEALSCGVTEEVVRREETLRKMLVGLVLDGQPGAKVKPWDGSLFRWTAVDWTTADAAREVLGRSIVQLRELCP